MMVSFFRSCVHIIFLRLGRRIVIRFVSGDRVMISDRL